MSKQVKQKLCWNCEGSVARNLENCPFCGVYLNPEENSDAASEANDPFYVPDPQASDAVPDAPYVPQVSAAEAKSLVATTAANSVASSTIIAILCLSFGVIAALFALLLFFFSVDGKLTMQWEEDLWSLFAIAALPLLFFGWRRLNSLSDP